MFQIVNNWVFHSKGVSEEKQRQGIQKKKRKKESENETEDINSFLLHGAPSKNKSINTK